LDISYRSLPPSTGLLTALAYKFLLGSCLPDFARTGLSRSLARAIR
jgi:hypothetical protein